MFSLITVPRTVHSWTTFLVVANLDGEEPENRRLSMGSASDKEPLDDAKVLVARGGGGDAPT